VLSLPAAVRIYLCTAPTDLRRGFDGLAAMTREVLHEDPLSGHLFVFCNRRGDRLKLLYWDRDGYAVWYKRLEKGRFHLLTPPDSDGRIDGRALAMILEGMDPASVRRRPRLVLPAPTP
jgi:transposase